MGLKFTNAKNQILMLQLGNQFTISNKKGNLIK